MSHNPSGETSQHQYDEVVRSMIQQENELINQRLSWLTTVQGLLFTALGFSWEKTGAHRLVNVLIFLGVAISVIVLQAITFATMAMWRLHHWWEQNKPASYKGPDIIGLPPPKIITAKYIGAWSFIPLLFIIAWVAVWFIK